MTREVHHLALAAYRREAQMARHRSPHQAQVVRLSLFGAQLDASGAPDAPRHGGALASRIHDKDGRIAATRAAEPRRGGMRFSLFDPDVTPTLQPERLVELATHREAPPEHTR